MRHPGMQRRRVDRGDTHPVDTHESSGAHAGWVVTDPPVGEKSSVHGLGAWPLREVHDLVAVLDGRPDSLDPYLGALAWNDGEV